MSLFIFSKILIISTFSSVVFSFFFINNRRGQILKFQYFIHLGPIKVKQARHQIPTSNAQSSESTQPLLLLIGNEIEKPVEPMINFSQNFLRPKSTPMNIHKRNSNALLTMFHEPSTATIRTKTSDSNSNLFAPILSSGNSTRKSAKTKFNNQQNAPNLDTLYRIALQNQTACNSIEQAQIDKRKLLDKNFASQHRALRATMRSAGLVH